MRWRVWSDSCYPALAPSISSTYAQPLIGCCFWFLSLSTHAVWDNERQVQIETPDTEQPTMTMTKKKKNQSSVKIQI